VWISFHVPTSHILMASSVGLASSWLSGLKRTSPIPSLSCSLVASFPSAILHTQIIGSPSCPSQGPQEVASHWPSGLKAIQGRILYPKGPRKTQKLLGSLGGQGTSRGACWASHGELLRRSRARAIRNHLITVIIPHLENYYIDGRLYSLSPCIYHKCGTKVKRTERKSRMDRQLGSSLGAVSWRRASQLGI
jgi:hypothetical protein